MSDTNLFFSDEFYIFGRTDWIYFRPKANLDPRCGGCENKIYIKIENLRNPYY